MKIAIAFLRADHGQEIRQAVGVLAVAIAVTYVLGFTLGQFVHSLNDRLAGVQRDIPTITAPVLIRPAASMAQAPAPLPPTITAPPLADLTVAELRVMARQAGHRKLARSGRRSQLLEVLA